MCIKYKIDSESIGNFNAIQNLKHLAVEVNNRGIVYHNKNPVVLKHTIGQIAKKNVCTVRLRHKEKIARCRFFVVPRDDPVLLGSLP